METDNIIDFAAYRAAHKAQEGIPETVECIGFFEPGYRPLLDADGKLPSERRNWI